MDSLFPVFPVGTVFKEFDAILSDTFPLELKYKKVTVKFPMRLNGMSIDSSAIALEGVTSFPAGEISFAIEKFISVTISVSGDKKLHISENIKRRSIIEHACLVMCKALKVEPFFDIDVVCDNLKIHSGFGTSGATMGAVCAAINEMYGNPINCVDLIKYIANNYGEEVGNDDNKLQLVQCIGGSIASGLMPGGITIITGDATPIVSERYETEVIIGTPTDFYPKSPKEMMELEESHLESFEIHGKRYAFQIAYDLLHKGLPNLKCGNIDPICDIIFRHRFKMGSIKNCSFVYPQLVKISENIEHLYTDKLCKLLSLSSVGPSFFVIPDGDKKHEQICIETLMSQGMSVIKTAIFNRLYIVNFKE